MPGEINSKMFICYKFSPFITSTINGNKLRNDVENFSRVYDFRGPLTISLEK